MKKIAMAAAFLALAGATGTASAAQSQSAPTGGKGRFERLDTNSSGDITFDEFQAAMIQRWDKADADHDGKITVAELAETIQRGRRERIAARIMARFDTNKDGVLTREELDARAKTLFTRLDKNGDGKIVASEVPAPMKRQKNRQG